MKWIFSLRSPAFWSETTPCIRINGRWYWFNIDLLLQDMEVELGVKE